MNIMHRQFRMADFIDTYVMDMKQRVVIEFHTTKELSPIEIQRCLNLVCVESILLMCVQ
jgi:hypothetical protein